MGICHVSNICGNLEGFKILFHDDHARLKLAEPFNLLKDIDTFNRHKMFI